MLSMTSFLTGVPSLRNSGTYSSYSLTLGHPPGADAGSLARNLRKLDPRLPQPTGRGLGDDESVVRQRRARRVTNQESPGPGPVRIAYANHHGHAIAPRVYLNLTEPGFPAKARTSVGVCTLAAHPVASSTAIRHPAKNSGTSTHSLTV